MRKDTITTRKRIIDSAERLFAEKGVEATSLLDITRASGQKNRSALQYHFNNKDGLIHAVLDKHALDIAERRTAMLNQLEAQGTYTLYELVQALVVPLAEEIDNQDGGQHFLKIHSELMSTRKYRLLRAERDKDFNDIGRLLKMTAPFFGTSNAGEQNAKEILIGTFLIHGLANYLLELKVIPRATFIHVLVQSLVDLIKQPASS